jgi:hypothetical protein
MNDSMNLHPSSYHSENQQNTNEGEKLSFIRNYTDYVNVIYEMKHFGCFFQNKNAFVSSLSAEKCTETIEICAEKCSNVMERLVLQELIQWKAKSIRKPLIVNGARQVGKTWLLHEFARTQYAKEAYLVCRKITPQQCFLSRRESRHDKCLPYEL